MRIAIVSDIHGQIDALERALALMAPFDRLFALGDSIDQTRFSTPVVNLLRQANAETILGNHEKAFLEGEGAARRVAAIHDTAARDWLCGRPYERRLTVAGRRILLVHSTPWSSGHAYVSSIDPRFERFGQADADIVLYGHTHQPLVQRLGDTLVVNPGSVGQGRPTPGGFVNSCAVLDPEALDATIINFVL